jgi:acetyl esterase/lipase
MNYMQYFKKEILIDTTGKSDYTATLQAYIPDNSPEVDPNRLHPAVLILPGGGYEFTSDRENEPMALKFASEGVCAFVLKYSCAPARFPQALCEALASIRYIRENAAEFSIDTENIVVCGFSAGGHLAASVGVFWNNSHVGGKREFGDKVKPNKLILAYPVIKHIKNNHQRTFDNLLGDDNKSDEYFIQTNLDKQISSDTPPSFIWHTYEDNVVPVQNSIAFASELVEHAIPVELHIYRRGGHGLSLGNHIVENKKDFSYRHDSSDWIDKAIRFIFD